MRRYREPFRSTGVRRAIVVAEIGFFVLVQFYRRVTYGNRRLRWQAQGAVSRWENNLERRDALRLRGKRRAPR
jgi:hypothetical protein